MRAGELPFQSISRKADIDCFNSLASLIYARTHIDLDILRFHLAGSCADSCTFGKAEGRNIS